jgi:flagellar export protein FliJ
MQLAEALQFRARVEQQQEFLSNVRQAEREQLRREISQGNIPVASAIQSMTYDGLLHRYADRLAEQLHQIEAVIEQRRGTLREAEKGVRVLEKLEEKERRRYDLDVDSAERELLDEIALAAEMRKRWGQGEEL